MKIWPKSSLIKNRLFIALCCLVAAVVVSTITAHITITITPSVDPRVFWTLQVDKDEDFKVARDSYIRARVTIDFPSQPCVNCSIVKRVGCAPGSYLETRGKDFYCDGSFIGKAKRQDFMRFNLRLSKGQVFLIGDNPRSYDSRYFGLVNKNAIDAKLIPLM